MKIISIFNNKGGVGKTTLTFHIAHALATQGKRILLIDLDPQCNLSIFCMKEEQLESIWKAEEPYIDDFDRARRSEQFKKDSSLTRTIHFLLKPIEDGVTEVDKLVTPAFKVSENLDLIPGRLTLHKYEDRVARRWSDVYQGDPLAIRTITGIRETATNYGEAFGYDFVIVDTSPSLGSLNKTIISTVDGFLIPCMPDMFSLYGIKNIGSSLSEWKKDFNTIFKVISEEKRHSFPADFVQFLGYTIFNAKRYTGNNEWDLSMAHYNFAQEIPAAIRNNIAPEVRGHLSDAELSSPIGGMAVMHSMMTKPAMAQKYHVPIWAVPTVFDLEPDDKATILGNRKDYERTKDGFVAFTKDMLDRISKLP
jgi:cellulose biosynthesis protein BcsQ